MLKGLVAGGVSLAAAALLGQLGSVGGEVLAALLLGALSYGVSLVLFILALEKLGSSRTGASFSFGPFVGAAVSIPCGGERLRRHAACGGPDGGGHLPAGHGEARAPPSPREGGAQSPA